MTNPDLAAMSDAATKAEAALEAKPGDGALIDAYITALGAYNGALIRLHRSGDLVLIAREGMRERAALCIWHQLGQNETDVRADQLTKAEVAVLADAAIAAILGEG